MRLSPSRAGLGLFALVLAFYTFTLQPSLAWGDGVRLQREAVTGESFILAEMVRADFAPDPFPFARLGIAAWDHPLWVIVTHLAVRALPGLPALWVVNFASALFGAAAILFLYLLLWEHARSLPAAMLAALALAVAHTFWFHAVTPEVYTLLAALLLAAAWAWLRYRSRPSPLRHAERERQQPVPPAPVAREASPASIGHAEGERHQSVPPVRVAREASPAVASRLPWLLLAAFLLGLAAANHLLAFLALPALLLAELLRWASERRVTPGLAPTPGASPVGGLSARWRRRPRGRGVLLELEVVFAALAFLLGFSPYLIQSARLLRTFPLSEVMGPAFGSTFFSGLAATTPLDLVRSALTLAVFVVLQFNPLGAMLGVWGLWRGAAVSPSLWRLAAAGLVVYGAFGVLYRVADQFAFFLPAHVFFALALGLGLAQLLAGAPRYRRPLLGLTLAGILAMPLIYAAAPRLARALGAGDEALGIPAIGAGARDGLAYYVNPNKRGDLSADDFGRQVLADLPPHALVLAEWYTDTDEYFVLRYLIAVEGLRPDVEVAGWPTEDPFSFDRAVAVALVEAALPRRPVYLASLSDDFYNARALAARYCLIVEHQLYRVLPAPPARTDCLTLE